MVEYDLPKADSFPRLTFDDMSAMSSCGSPLPLNLASRCSSDREIVRVVPCAGAPSSASAEAAESKLLHFQKNDQVELEFLPHRHLLIFFPDGVFGDVEWSNKTGIRRALPSPPDGAIFNLSREYLRLRVRRVKSDFRVLLVLIGPTLLNCEADNIGNVAFFNPKKSTNSEVRVMAETLRRICKELEHPGPYTTVYLHALLMLTFANLMRSSSSEQISRRPIFSKGGLASWRLKRALELLEDNSSQAPTLASVARALELHPTSFCRAFKQSTGVTPHRYLLLCRVNRAKQMMKNSAQTLTEIALDCGFSGSSQFSVVFKRIEGMSPRLFKRSI